MKDDDILKDAKEAFDECVEAEADNRADALDDLRFARLGEQWDEAVRQQRDKDRRPCLTINKLPAFIRQVVNDARQNKPQIKVKPVDDKADPKTAEVLDGLIRNIEYISNASAAYDTAADHAVSQGFGYLKVGIEYSFDDTFDKDILIQRVANPFMIYGDPRSVAADSSDWNVAFETEMIAKDEFKRRWKGADEIDWDEAGYNTLDTPWRQDDDILVAVYWTREEESRPIVLLSDQRIVDLDVYEKGKDVYDIQGVTVLRERTVKSHKVTRRVLTGSEVLEEVDWVGRWIPIVPVYGDEINVEGKRHFRSLIRDAKDAQRMFNYWRTTSTELVALAPKAPWVGPVGAFASDAKRWATANTESHAYLEYDAVAGAPPQRQPFAGVPAGAIQEALNAADDMKAIVGLYDASLGARSNETSGRAIMARQREGDVSTYHFIDNLTRAITHMGRIVIDLIPHVYDGPRIVRVLGEDGATAPVAVNQQVGPDGRPLPPEAQADPPAGSTIFDLTAGKYDVAVEAGPSFTTRREEAAAQMTELIRAMPQAAPLIGDLLAKNLDWPGADEIAKRLKTIAPVDDTNVAAQKAQADLAVAQQEIAKLNQQLQSEKMDKAIEAEKLKISAFEAETDRMKAAAELQAAQSAPAEMPGHPVMHNGSADATLLQAQKQLGEVASAQMAHGDQAAKLGALTEQLAGLVQMMATQAAPSGPKEIVIQAPSGGVYRGVVGSKPN